MANCAGLFLTSLTALAISTQEEDIEPSIVGKSVVREGEVFSVTDVKFTTRKITLVDSIGQKKTVSFDRFFDKRVDVVETRDDLLEVTSDVVVSAWLGRVLFDRNGRQWKIIKIQEQAAGADRLITLRDDIGNVVIFTVGELAQEKFKYRQRRALSVTQKLAGAYAV